MGIFDKIKEALWGDTEAEARASETPVEDTYLGTSQATTGIVPDVSTSANDPVMRDVAAAGVQPVSKPAAIEQAQNPATPAGNVDIAAQLDRAVAANGQKLAWRHSIVDLMKALNMDASLQERKELAAELGYSGDANDSASMNTFLHRALMQKLSDHGGKVPPELLD